MWFVAELCVRTKDVIELQSLVMTPNGLDEMNTWRRIYEVDDEVEIEVVQEYNLGHKNFPILEGPVKEVMSVSKHDERMDDVQSVYEELRELYGKKIL